MWAILHYIFSLSRAVFVLQARMKNSRLRGVPDGTAFEDIEFRLLTVMGNVYNDHLYVSDWEDVDSLCKQTYNNVSRKQLPDPLFAPKHMRNGGKQDILAFQQWAFNSWCNGKVVMGWIHCGAKWGLMMWPPLSAFKKNVMVMRGECVLYTLSVCLVFAQYLLLFVRISLCSSYAQCSPV